MTRKEDRYLDLISDAKRAGYSPTLITLDMGSRGLPNMDGFQKLRDTLRLQTPVFNNLLLNASQQAVLGSHKSGVQGTTPTTSTERFVHVMCSSVYVCMYYYLILRGQGPSYYVLYSFYVGNFGNPPLVNPPLIVLYHVC